MKIVGCVIAHDEAPSMLSNAVAGFARFCDAIVYCEGAYALYPGARPRSRPEEAEAVVQACEVMDVECLVHRPKDVYWGNEVEKRNKAVQLAGAIGADWIVMFDADYHVMKGDPAMVRLELENTDLLVASYTLLDGMDVLDDGGEEFAEMARNIDVSTEWTIGTRDIFRYTPDLRYGPAHYQVRGTYEGEDTWLKGPEMSTGFMDRSAECLPLRANLVAVHRRAKRSQVRKETADAYYRIRDGARIEVFDANDVYGANPVA